VNIATIPEGFEASFGLSFNTSTMKNYLNSFLVCLSLFMVLTISGCNDDEETLGDAYEKLMNSIDLTGGGPKGPSVPNFDNLPSIVMDSTSTSGSDAITLWMTVSCNIDMTFILHEINVEYRDVESTQFQKEDFIAGPDTLMFEKGLQQSYSINVVVDSLQTRTNYTFCASAKYVFNGISTSSTTGCRDEKTKE
jgi:hypothetical protein